MTSNEIQTKIAEKKARRTDISASYAKAREVSASSQNSFIDGLSDEKSYLAASNRERALSDALAALDSEITRLEGEYELAAEAERWETVKAQCLELDQEAEAAFAELVRLRQETSDVLWNHCEKMVQATQNRDHARQRFLHTISKYVSDVQSGESYLRARPELAVQHGKVADELRESGLKLEALIGEWFGTTHSAFNCPLVPPSVPLDTLITSAQNIVAKAMQDEKLVQEMEALRVK